MIILRQVLVILWMIPIRANTMKLLYFAWVRERIGLEQEEIELPTDVETATDLIEWLKSRGPEYENALTDSEKIRVAVDQRHISQHEPLGQANEIAIFPPMTGG